MIQMVSPSDKIAEGLYEVLFTDADNHAGPVILSNEPEKFKLFMAGFNGYDNSKVVKAKRTYFMYVLGLTN